jgi:DNA-binding NarL/FixJ family response regulator
VIGRSEPDLAIVDLSLKDSHGIDLIKDIRANRPQLPLLVLSMHDESLFAERALRAGANGYISKQEATAKILAAIRRVLGEGVYLSEHIEAKILRHALQATSDSAASLIEALSDREFQIFQLIGQGHDTQSIVKVLHLDARTVGTYRMRIREKLKLPRPNDLLRYAVQWIQGQEASAPQLRARTAKAGTPDNN